MAAKPIGRVSEESQRYLGSKSYFAQISLANDIPAIPTLDYYPKGTKIEATDIFRKQSFFLKPDRANHSQGCFSLFYIKKTDNYLLIKEKEESGQEDEKQILRLLNQQLLVYDYILQPILENHPEITDICGTGRLTTMRVITYSCQGVIKPFSAIFEAPISMIDAIISLSR